MFARYFATGLPLAPPADTRHFLQLSRRGLTPRRNHHHFDANKKKKKKKTHFVLMRKDTGGWGVEWVGGWGFGGGKKRSCCGGFCRVFNASLVLRPPPQSLPSLHTHKHKKFLIYFAQCSGKSLLKSCHSSC